MMESEVVAALAAALPTIANPAKDGTSHHGKFATLPALLDHVKPLLAAHGLAVMQRATADGVQTLFVHSSGGVFDAGTYPVTHLADPQKMGSAVTYARRYGAMAALGVSGSDDDGNAAAATSTRKPPKPKLASKAQIQSLQIGMGELGMRDREVKHKFVTRIIGRDIETTKELTPAEANKVITEMNDMQEDSRP